MQRWRKRSSGSKATLNLDLPLESLGALFPTAGRWGLASLAAIGFAALTPTFASNAAENPTPTVAAPPMGWSVITPEPLCDLSEGKVREIIREIVSANLTKVSPSDGRSVPRFSYVILENCWQLPYDSKAKDPLKPLVDLSRFPRGLRAVSDELHQHGLKLGLSLLHNTCEIASMPPLAPNIAPTQSPSNPPSPSTPAATVVTNPEPTVALDPGQLAATLTEWGVDLVRVRSCEASLTQRLTTYQGIAAHIKKPLNPKPDTTNDEASPPLLSLNDPAVLGSAAWAMGIGPLWSVDREPASSWMGVLNQANGNTRLSALSGSGHWNEPGPLWPRQAALSWEQKKTQWALWVLMGSPLFVPYDLQHFDRSHRKLLANTDVLSILEDRIGLQGMPWTQTDAYGIWVKPMAQPGSRALAIFNKTSVDQTVKFEFEELGIEGPFTVRDLWTGDRLHTYPAYPWSLEPYGSQLILVTGKERPVETGDISLVDRTPIYAGGLISSERRRAVVAGIRYSKGLVASGPSVVRYYLGGNCSRFRSLAGFDDDNLPEGVLGFEVWGDGVKLYASKALSRQKHLVAVDLKINQVNYLDLVVQSGSESLQETFGNWIHPVITCKQRSEAKDSAASGKSGAPTTTKNGA